jgi:hypothetical protein
MNETRDLLLYYCRVEMTDSRHAPLNDLAARNRPLARSCPTLRSGRHQAAGCELYCRDGIPQPQRMAGSLAIPPADLSLLAGVEHTTTGEETSYSEGRRRAESLGTWWVRP